MVGGCSKDSVFFLELFVGVVQTFRQSFSHQSFPSCLDRTIAYSVDDPQE